MSGAADQAGERIAQLLGEIRDAADAPLAARVEDLVREIVDLYGAGLARTLEVAGDGAARALADDPLVGALLVLHGLHPADARARIEEALERVRPYLASHAGGVTLVEVDGARARVRLEGTCTSCASSSQTIEQLIERAIQEAAPEIARVEVEQAARDERDARATLVQLGRRAEGAR